MPLPREGDATRGHRDRSFPAPAAACSRHGPRDSTASLAQITYYVAEIAQLTLHTSGSFLSRLILNKLIPYKATSSAPKRFHFLASAACLVGTSQGPPACKFVVDDRTRLCGRWTQEQSSYLHTYLSSSSDNNDIRSPGAAALNHRVSCLCAEKANISLRTLCLLTGSCRIFLADLGRYPLLSGSIIHNSPRPPSAHAVTGTGAAEFAASAERPPHIRCNIRHPLAGRCRCRHFQLTSGQWGAGVLLMLDRGRHC